MRPSVVPVLLLAAGALPAQERPRHPLDVRGYGVVYDVPATRDVRVRRNVTYLSSERGELKLDVYSPPGMKAGERRPVVVFLNAIGESGPQRVKDWEIYRSWPRLVAAHGLVGVSMESDGQRIGESLRGVFRFLESRGAELGIDGSRVGVDAASANVTGASDVLLDSAPPPNVKAAVLYYGRPPAKAPRADLPVLFLVAESDAPGMRPRLDSLWTRVVEQKAPWRLLFASGQPHAFDGVSEDENARRLIQETLAFWTTHLGTPGPLPPRSAPPAARRIVATQYGAPGRLTDLLAPWLARNPSDTTALTMYGRALAGERRFAEAESAFARAFALDSTNGGAINGLAQAKLSAEKWAEAASLLERATRHGVDGALLRGQLGWTLLKLGRNDEAARAYERAFEIGIPPGRATQGVAAYNLACAYARLGRREQALAMLSRAIDNGMTDRAAMEGDPDLAVLKGEPRFRELLERTR